MLGVPAAALREVRVPMVDLWGAEAGDLGEQAGAAPDARARVAVLETAVRRRLTHGPPVDPMARAVAQRLAAPPPGLVGRLPALAGPPPRPAGVAGLAADLGVSER